MAGFAVGLAGSILGGIFGGNAARNAGRTIGAAGTASGNQIGKDALGAQTDIKSAVAGGAQNFDWAKGGVDQAVQFGQQGVNQAGQDAISGINGARDSSNALQGKLLGDQLGNLNPYLQSGAQGTEGAAALVKQGFHAPTADEAAATPGFQFQMQQGLNGLTQQFGANGGAATGGALKALTQYGQGVASTYYQNAFNNSLQSYNTNLSGNLALSGQGLQASQLGNQATQNFGNSVNANNMGAAQYAGNIGVGTSEYGAGLGMQGAGLDANLLTGKSNYQLAGTEAADAAQTQGDISAGNFYMQGAQGTAAGQMGQANAWSGAANSFGNSMMGAFGGGFGANPYSGGGFGTQMLTPGNPYGAGGGAGAPYGWGAMNPGGGI